MTKYTKTSEQNPFRVATVAKRLIVLFGIFYCVTTALLPQSVIANTDHSSFYQNFENLSFKNQHGKHFRVSSLNHKVVVFNFIYTQCSTVCPIQTNTLAKVFNALPPQTKSKVRLVSVSLDPLNDTPEKLMKFAKKHHADMNNWSFITGNPDDVAALSDRLKLFGLDKKTSDSALRPNDHSTHLWLIDARGQVMMRYKGNPIDEARISKEITQLSNL